METKVRPRPLKVTMSWRKWTQDVVAEGFHDAEIDGHQFVDKVARRFGVVRDHHAALKEPRGGERRLVGVHGAKRVAIEGVGVESLFDRSDDARHVPQQRG
jgi:hypothetical protein